jgi:hypothetical protein
MPTVVGKRLLVPDWGGYMYCIDAATGVHAMAQVIVTCDFWITT